MREINLILCFIALVCGISCDDENACTHDIMVNNECIHMQVEFPGHNPNLIICNSHSGEAEVSHDAICGHMDINGDSVDDSECIVRCCSEERHHSNEFVPYGTPCRRNITQCHMRYCDGTGICASIEELVPEEAFSDVKFGLILAISILPITVITIVVYKIITTN